jgi:hypothetical protein
VKHSCEIGLSKVDFVAALKPGGLFYLVFFHRENGDLHALLVVISFLDHVHYGEGPNALLNVPEPKEKPYIVSVRVYVVLNHQEVLTGLTG